MSHGAVPETHERIREEDIQETIDIFAAGNAAITALSAEQVEWLRVALAERRYLCENQFHEDGTVSADVTERLKVLDGHIQSVSPDILKVLHFLGRIRAIMPVLQELQEKLNQPNPDPNMQMIVQMQFDCSKAEVKAAVDGLAHYLVRPRILTQSS